MDVSEYLVGERIGRDSVVALGFFDGVHVAHRRLLSAAADIAHRDGRELCVFTFPSESEHLKRDARRIYPTSVKLSLFASLGVDRVVLADFDAVADMSAQTFVSDVLVRDLGCAVAVCGYNFRFSKGAGADAQVLQMLLAAQGRTCHIEPPVCFEGRELSATAIRAYLGEGAMDMAARALGAPYRMVGVGERGLGLGHRLGTPTVNLTLPPSFCQPKGGVYRCFARVEGVTYHALTNYGTCPTFGARPVHAECWILDFDGDLYGKEVTVYFLGYLREERIFSSAEELKMQINIDKNMTVTQNPSPNGWQE